MQKTSINPEILQPMLESAANAAEKGQSQFFTPLPFGRKLVEALPSCRPAIVDLNCGAGYLLQASVTQRTRCLLGLDIDPCRGKAVEGATLPVHRITGDASCVYSRLREVNFAADLFVLNPPWRLFLHRANLELLAESALPSVRMAFKAIEPGIPAGTIDSTIAMLLVALDLCTTAGEGLLIANNATLERLIFEPGAPHSAIVKHIWARVIIPGNPMTGLDNGQWTEDQQFYTSVIYFARDHTTGPRTYRWPNLPDRSFRLGSELRSEYASASTNAVELWNAVRDQVAEDDGRKKPKVPFNLWLENGVIRTALSLFEEHSIKIDKAKAERLFALDGKYPMQLVLQRAGRDELLHVAQQSGWRVQPELLAAVHQAIQEYHANRAPLYPLPEIQRLGYLDEPDAIVCKQDLMDGPRLVFRKGKSYPLRTQSVSITRTATKPNSFTGELEDIEFSGEELAIFVANKPKGTEFCFMDARLTSDPATEIQNAKERPYMPSEGNTNERAVDFNLQQLCTHFEIPDVPDVASVQPELYNEMLETLTTLETTMGIKLL